MNKSSITTGVKKFLDFTVGNVGIGLGFGSAYAAEVPVLGAPVRSLNEGVAKGFNLAQTKILASKIVNGKANIEDEMAKLQKDQQDYLATEVGRARGQIKSDEKINSKTGEVIVTKPFGADLENDPNFGAPKPA